MQQAHTLFTVCDETFRMFHWYSYCIRMSPDLSIFRAKVWLARLVPDCFFPSSHSLGGEKVHFSTKTFHTNENLIHSMMTETYYDVHLDEQEACNNSARNNVLYNNIIRLHKDYRHPLACYFEKFLHYFSLSCKIIQNLVFST